MESVSQLIKILIRMDFMPKFPLKPAAVMNNILPPPFANVRSRFEGESRVPTRRIADSSSCKYFDHNHCGFMAEIKCI